MTTDESVRQVLDHLESAWNSGDGEAYAAPYATDARFVNVRGAAISGRQAIGAGHQGIFETVYAGSTNAMELIDTIPVADGVLLALTSNTLSVPAGPLAGRHRATGTNLLRRTASGWEIVSTHNTLVEEPA